MLTEEKASHLQTFHQKKGPVLPALPQTKTVKVKTNARNVHFVLQEEILQKPDGTRQPTPHSAVSHRRPNNPSSNLDSPRLGFGKLSCRRKTTLSTKCWMSHCSGPRTNTIQSWVNPSVVGFFRSWALCPSSNLTWTVHCLRTEVRP